MPSKMDLTSSILSPPAPTQWPNYKLLYFLKISHFPFGLWPSQPGVEKAGLRPCKSVGVPVQQESGSDQQLLCVPGLRLALSGL